MKESAVFTGTVWHDRRAPKKRAFSYPVYMLYLDLEELENGGAPFGGSRLFSTRRPAPARFRRSDFRGDASQPLSETIRTLIQTRTGDQPDGPIRVLANVRTLGYQFNPIAIYYVFDDSGEALTHVVADVTNMPWRESHAYVLTADADGVSVDGEAEKKMHVSPYLEMDYVYRLRTALPGVQLGVEVSDSRDGVVEFAAGVGLERSGSDAAALRRALIRFPAMALLVTGRIFWQSLRMRLAGYKWIPKDKKEARARVEVS
jgi:DUF1365 family protein